MYYESILLAAGQGRRMGASRNKILLHLLGKPVIVYSLEVFLADPACHHIVLVVQEDEKELMSQIIKRYFFPSSKKKISIVVGGVERQESVYCGLLAVKRLNELVMVHDGARPFVTLAQLKSIYKKASENKAAILGVPVKDTIKKVIAGKVSQTISREELWQIQTPQAFLGKELFEAQQLAKEDDFLGTDDASLMEKYGSREIDLVLGSYDNIKLTTPDDMMMGESILRRRIKQA